MAGNLVYLLTLLPTLPALGEPIPAEDPFARLREDGHPDLLLLADLLEAEETICRHAFTRFVQDDREKRPALPETLPEPLVEALTRDESIHEAAWLDQAYAAWFGALAKAGEAIGSPLLTDWANTEHALRAGFARHRKPHAAVEPAPGDDPFDAPLPTDPAGWIDAYYAIPEPLKAERLLDEARIDHLRRSAIDYSFATDELVAYLLQLRILRRHAAMDREAGLKIIQEVTAL